MSEKSVFFAPIFHQNHPKNYIFCVKITHFFDNTKNIFVFILLQINKIKNIV